MILFMQIKVKEVRTLFLIGLFMTCSGVPISIWAIRILYVLNTNSYARLRGGLTEDDILAIAMIGVLLAVIGIALMIFGKMKRKNTEISDSIINSGSLNYCPRCNANVNSRDGKCPICNQKIGG